MEALIKPSARPLVFFFSSRRRHTRWNWDWSSDVCSFDLEDLRRRENRARGYVEVRTPLIYDSELWKTSGHWEKYSEHMFTFESENKEFGLKPMNCPGQDRKSVV